MSPPNPRRPHYNQGKIDVRPFLSAIPSDWAFFVLKMAVTKVGDEPCQENGSLVLTYGRWVAEVYIGKKDGGERRQQRKGMRGLQSMTCLFFRVGVTKLR